MVLIFIFQELKVIIFFGLHECYDFNIKFFLQSISLCKYYCITIPAHGNKLQYINYI